MANFNKGILLFVFSFLFQTVVNIFISVNGVNGFKLEQFEKSDINELSKTAFIQHLNPWLTVLDKYNIPKYHVDYYWTQEKEKNNQNPYSTEAVGTYVSLVNFRDNTKACLVDGKTNYKMAGGACPNWGKHIVFLDSQGKIDEQRSWKNSVRVYYKTDPPREQAGFLMYPFEKLKCPNKKNSFLNLLADEEFDESRCKKFISSTNILQGPLFGSKMDSAKKPQNAFECSLLSRCINKCIPIFPNYPCFRNLPAMYDSSTNECNILAWHMQMRDMYCNNRNTFSGEYILSCFKPYKNAASSKSAYLSSSVRPDWKDKCPEKPVKNAIFGEWNSCVQTVGNMCIGECKPYITSNMILDTNSAEECGKFIFDNSPSDYPGKEKTKNPAYYWSNFLPDENKCVAIAQLPNCFVNYNGGFALTALGGIDPNDTIELPDICINKTDEVIVSCERNDLCTPKKQIVKQCKNNKFYFHEKDCPTTCTNNKICHPEQTKTTECVISSPNITCNNNLNRCCGNESTDENYCCGKRDVFECSNDQWIKKNTENCSIKCPSTTIITGKPIGSSSTTTTSSSSSPIDNCIPEDLNYSQTCIAKQPLINCSTKDCCGGTKDKQFCCGEKELKCKGSSIKKFAPCAASCDSTSSLTTIPSHYDSCNLNLSNLAWCTENITKDPMNSNDPNNGICKAFNDEKSNYNNCMNTCCLAMQDCIKQSNSTAECYKNTMINKGANCCLQSSNNSHAAAIAGGVIGAVILLAIIGAVYYKNKNSEGKKKKGIVRQASIAEVEGINREDDDNEFFIPVDNEYNWEEDNEIDENSAPSQTTVILPKKSVKQEDLPQRDKSVWDESKGDY